MLPEIAWTTSSRVGFGLRSSSALAAMSMPGVQKPHCAAKPSMNASWRGWKALPWRRPAAVSTARPAQASASIRQARWGSPSISTVQAPQVPCPQPALGEVSPAK
jgi:hypothetical protein